MAGVDGAYDCVAKTPLGEQKGERDAVMARLAAEDPLRSEWEAERP